MRVLVTGHHGYIGSVGALMLHEARHDVTGLDTFFYEGCDLLDDAVKIPTLRVDFATSRPTCSRDTTGSSIWRRCPTIRSASSTQS